MYTPLAIASEAREPEPAHQAILPWLDMLRQLYPPSALLLVGAGGGSSPWVQYLMATGHRNVTLIEADETTANRLKIATQEHPDWIVKSHVIGRHSAPTPFYTASLQTESGLLEPESLRSLWPNLKSTHKQTHQAIALAELQEDAETPANWLMVDCLPALPIIQGLSDQLDSFDVIAARVLLDDTARPGSLTSQNELEPFLIGHGYRCVAIEPGRHPAIGHSLFVSDPQALLSKQRQQHTEDIERANAQAEQLLKSETDKLQQLSQTEKAAWDKEKVDLLQARDKADGLVSDKQALIVVLEQRLQHMQHMLANSVEADVRQRQAQDEFIKAEAQIELIKELMLRECGQ